jgi:hypothetical protein
MLPSVVSAVKFGASSPRWMLVMVFLLGGGCPSVQHPYVRI